MAGEKTFPCGVRMSRKQLEIAHNDVVMKLLRLEDALFTYIGHRDDPLEFRRVMHAAQQDNTDFQPLWDLLDERARNAGTGSEEHY